MSSVREAERILGYELSTSKSEVPGGGSGLEVLETTTIKELLEKYKDLPAVEYHKLLGLEGLVVKGWSHLLAGESKAGKTELMIDFCMRTNDRVLYVTEEAPKPWLKKIRDRGDVDIPNLEVAFALGHTLDVIKKLIEEKLSGVNPPEIVILDTTRQLLRMENENDNSEVSRKISAITAVVTHQYGKTLIFTHHTNKKIGALVGHEIAGGSAFTGAVDVWLVIKRAPDQPEGSRHREISGRGRDDGDIAPIVYEMTEEFKFKVLGSPSLIKSQSIRDRVAGALTDKFQEVKAIWETLDEDDRPSQESVRKALLSLATDGEALRDPDIKLEARGKTHLYANLQVTSNNFQQPLPTSNLQAPTPQGTGGLEVQSQSASNSVSSKNIEEKNPQTTSKPRNEPQPPTASNNFQVEENSQLLEDVKEVFGADMRDSSLDVK